DGRVVGEAQLGQFVQGPRGVADDAERRRPVAEYRRPGDLLQHVLAPLQDGAKRVGREVVDALVGPAVAGDLVAAPGDGADQGGVVAGGLPYDEEGRPDLGPGQLIQQPSRRHVDAVAVVSRQSRVDAQAGGRLDPVVFLDVETEDDAG